MKVADTVVAYSKCGNSGDLYDYKSIVVVAGNDRDCLLTPMCGITKSRGDYDDFNQRQICLARDD